MSRKNFRVAQVVVGAAVAVVLGYVVARRYRGQRTDTLHPVGHLQSPIAQNAGVNSEHADLAIDLDGLFDEEPASGIEPTVQLSERAPAPQSGDDAEAPAPDDLGRAWLAQATEAEQSVSSSVPAPEDLPLMIDETEAQEDEANDPTVAEYIRKHRISSVG